jgi:hypothetical protein
MVAGAAGFSIVLSLVSGQLLRRHSPRTFVPWAFGVSGALVLAEAWILGASPTLASVIIYLHMAGIGAVLLSTFWSMLNEEFDPREAKRTFGRIAAGGTVGGLLGGLAAERAVAWTGSGGLMLLMAGLQLASGVFVAVVMAKAIPHPPDHSAVPVAKASAPHRSSLLRALAAIVLLGAFGAALLDYVFKFYATASVGRGNDLLRFFASFHAAVAASSFVLQSVCSKQLLEKFGLGKTILVLPATLAGGSFLTLVAPGALIATVVRAAEAAVRGSLFRAGYETSYTPVAAADKRLAKAFIDVAAERGGDALGAAVVYVCLLLAGASAPPWILSIAALAGLGAVIIVSALDRIYVQTLARSLQSQVVRLNLESDLDLTTLSLVTRAPTTYARATQLVAPVPPVPGEDVILDQVAALRSPDPRRVTASLRVGNVSDPLVATQVCLLLGRNDHAQAAHAALVGNAGKVLGLITDLMLDTSLEVSVRRRLPRIIASVRGQRSVDGLLAGLEDTRFEVRLACARSLAKICTRESRAAIPTQRILAAVDRELAIGTTLWETHRNQQRESGAEWLDDLLREKAHGSLEYVFTLLSLVHERAPLMAAFRSLHLEDRHLRGTALEYLEGILPERTREKLWEILAERPRKSAPKAKSKAIEELLNSSETVVLHLRKNGIPPDC